MPNKYQSSRGVTLIMVAAVLAILAALGTGFYSMMVMQTRSATRYADSVRADMMARAGVDFAVGQLHDQAFAKTEDPTDPWYMWDYLRGAKRKISYAADMVANGLDDDHDGTPDNIEEKSMGFSRALSATAGPNSDRFTLNIFDSASRININACDNIGGLLDNLCRVIGPPLVAADQDMLIPRVWEWYGGVAYNKNINDWPKSGAKGAIYGEISKDIYYWLYDSSGKAIPIFDTAGKLITDLSGRPATRNQAPYSGYFGAGADGTAVFGDGYAIAGYRARKGLFQSLEQVKSALTYVERSSPANSTPDHPLEQLEIEVKFAAIRDHITVNSWVDTSTVCTGKFEWVPALTSSGDPCNLAVDRDKSWVPDDPINDPENKRGSLRGCYVSIVNGHGAGQLRRIRTNGVDWIQIESFLDAANVRTGFVVPPGPASSYMIIANEDAKLADVTGSLTPFSYNGTGTTPPKLPPDPLPAGVNGLFPATRIDPSGAQYLDDDPNIDYVARPLCIHRAPVNINTASDKVLAALFMGINVTHGHFLSVGTDADMAVLAQFDPIKNKYKSRYSWQPNDPDWIVGDFDNEAQVYRTIEPFILTPKGIKRIPGSPGRLNFDVNYVANIKPLLPATYNMDYLNNFGTLDPAGTTNINEGNELAYRIMIARHPDPALEFIDPLTGAPAAAGNDAYKRGPFTSWDDFYFRVVKPWDDARQLRSIDGVGNQHKASVARLIMAHFNPNTDILKFNPNVEWIDRWGRNFTEMEPVMVYTNQQETADGVSAGGHGTIDGSGAIITCDQDGAMNADAVPVFSRERIGWGGGSPWFVCGVFGTEPKWNGSYVTRSFRYKSDEMIDKTDINRSNTEFSFDSRGVYEIQSVGQVMKRGEVLAERKIQALVKVYDVWTESTQRQFVNGYMSRATGNTGTPQSGTVGRDFKNVDSRLALTTLPEPLVPLSYTIKDPMTGATNAKNAEIVDTTIGGTSRKRNAWGIAVDINTPAVIANKVMPSGYDGQIILATNTQGYDPRDPAGDCDSFLASFTGDLDTATCKGNGHEQAKSPINCRVQVLDAFSVLGALNDSTIDSDPGLKTSDGLANKDVDADTFPYAGRPLEIYRYQSVRNALRGLRPEFYWNNVTCRQGDLRVDGVFVGGPGVTGNDGVMKFLCGDDEPDNYDNQNFNLNGRNASRAVGEDFNNRGAPGDVQGTLISMWTKTNWHQNDNRGHEFFDASNPGWGDTGIRCAAFWLRKQGGPQWAVCEEGGLNDLKPYEDGTWGVSGAGNRVNDLSLIGEHIQDGGDWSEPDWCMYLHGGTSGVPPTRTDPVRYPATYKPESPAYRIQPFRWQFLGARINLKKSFATSTNVVGGLTSPGGPGGAGKSGYMKSNQSPDGWGDTNSLWCTQNLFRPFVDSERWSDGPNYDYHAKYWVVHQAQGATGFNAYQDKGRKGGVASRGDNGQSVRWKWAHPYGDATADGRSITDNTIFGLNNCNPGRGYAPGGAGDFTSIYRGTPEEGTFAVIDEYKISRKDTVLANPPDWNSDRITRNDASRPGEMTLSRYYLPEDPTRRNNCPTFTSQTMLQSLKGYGTKTSTPPDYVTLARVTWNVFTPRFLHENKLWDKAAPKFSRPETITRSGGYQGNTNNAGVPTIVDVPFRGPFDYCVYNDLKDEKYEDFSDPKYDNDMNVVPYRCNRPTPAQYQNNLAEYKVDKSYHSSLGVEVAVLEDSDDQPDNNNETIKGNGGVPFGNPDALNKILDAGGMPIRVRSDRLRYRVWFRYPADQLADKNLVLKDDRGHTCVDPQSQYVLDTPVFDDISVTYFTKPRILDYREVTE
jgi:hypothetical protein